MKPTVWTIVFAIIAALIVAALGCYVLLELKNPWGAGLVLLALCIAFPTQIRTGVAEFTHSAADLKEAGVLVMPVVIDAQPGGHRKFDPPATVPSPDEGDEVGTAAPLPDPRPAAALRAMVRAGADPSMPVGQHIDGEGD